MSANSSLQPAAASDVPRKLSNSPPVEVLAMLLLFSVAAWHESVQLSALADSDVWWHLSTGAWILQNHTVPHTGLFSQYPDLPWIASNWLFDVLLAAAYKLVGISALVIFLMAFKVTIAVLMFALEFLACRLAGGYGAILHSRLAGADCLVCCIVRNRVEAPVPHSENGQGASPFLGPVSVSSVGQRGHGVYVRIVRTVLVQCH